MSRWDGGACMSCGRSRVLLVVHVRGVYRRDWLTDRLVRIDALPLSMRMTARCLDRRDCVAYQEAKRARQKVRGELPADAVLRELHAAEGGRCKWCGEPCYRKDKHGRIVVAKARMWHDGRTVDQRAEPEPNCVAEYYQQKFTLRGQLEARDEGVCAGCGADVLAAERAWREAIREIRARYEDRLYGDDALRGGVERMRLVSEMEEAVGAYLREHREPRWHADHVVPLEDGGEHLLANAQTLCEPCHVAKTAAENSARAARRRGDLPNAQERLELA